MSNLKHWIWLTQRRGIPGQIAVRLLERFGFSLVRVNPCGDTRLGYTMPEAELRLAF